MLDLRLPVGIFFLMIGLVLLGDGLLHPIKTPGVDIVLNRDWGVVLVVFGALMTFFGSRAQAAANKAEAAGPHETVPELRTPARGRDGVF